MWFLRGPKSKFKIDGQRVLGRENFSADKQISEQHVDLRVLENRLYVFDLGSMNGTFINGLQLLPGVRGELKNGHILRLGQTELRAEFDPKFVERRKDEASPEASESTEYAFAAIALCVSALSILIYFAMPSMAWGNSVGSKLSLTLAGLMAVSSALVAFPIAALLLRMEDRLLRNSIFSLSLLAGTFIAFNIVLGAADDQWQINQKMLGAKITYFCKTNFSERLCAQEIRKCPACMDVVERFNAQKKAEEQHMFTAPIPPSNLPKQISNPNAPIQ